MIILSLAKAFVAKGFLAQLRKNVAFARWKIAYSAIAGLSGCIYQNHLNG
ncbi:hypothetical protein H6F77_04295 [Microcoleus sp. FACHB-831]|jgi:hypothetical protein|nr:hypothetical protein [Microcoleus sp. FACHB-831]MBD1920338.1 hypothetical protein [Microcoleus sp. FACHB-831]